MQRKLVDSYKDKGARNKLITELRQKGIQNEDVLNAMQAVPRHFFFEPMFWNQAYRDVAFPIGNGQTISQPYTVAYQTQLLNIKPGHKVLEIGTGSGYQTSILCHLGADVYSIERHESLHKRSSALLNSIGYNAQLFVGDGTLGLPQHAPFHRIIVTAGVLNLPESLMQQLAIGGYMVIPVGSSTSQKMVRIIRLSEDDYDSIELETFRFVPLVGANGW